MLGTSANDFVLNLSGLRWGVYYAFVLELVRWK